MNRRKFEDVERVTVLSEIPDGSRGEIIAWNGEWATVVLDEGGTIVVHTSKLRRDGQ